MTRNLLTFNDSLGVHTFNIPAWSTCPGRTEFCAASCYARKGNFLYGNVIAGQHARFEDSRLPDFVERMTREIVRRGVTLLRIHSSGDFYSLTYLEAWREIARRCPGTRFFVYTRTWRIPEYRAALDAISEPNLVVWYSTDPSMSTETLAQLAGSPRVAYIHDPKIGAYAEDMPAVNCKKQLDPEKKDCTNCALCWGNRARSRGGAVTFHKH